MSEHRHARGQLCAVVSGDEYDGQRVEIVAHLEHRCTTHGALTYGCDLNGTHIAICEEQLAPVNKRKLN